MGGQTGGEEHGVPGVGLFCDDERQTLAFDEGTPLGPSARELLGPLLAPRSAALLWAENAAPVTIAPERGESRIEVALSYEGGAVRWVHFEPPHAGPDAGSGPGAATTEGVSATGVGTTTAVGVSAEAAAPTPSGDAGIASGPSLGGANDAGPFWMPPLCLPDRLEIEVSVRLRTAGGALDEAFTTTLQAAQVNAMQFTERLPLAALAGTFAVGAPPGTSADSLFVNVFWDASGFHGTLNGDFTLRSGSGDTGTVGSGLVEYAVWPPPDSSAGP